MAQLVDTDGIQQAMDRRYEHIESRLSHLEDKLNRDTKRNS